MKISILALVAGVVDLSKLIHQQDRVGELEKDVKALINDACGRCFTDGYGVIEYQCRNDCLIGDMHRKYIEGE